jgi:hypothetical protein
MTQNHLTRQIALIVLSAAGLAWALFGTVFAFLNQAPFMRDLMSQLWQPFLGSQGPDLVYDRLLAFALGVLGATMLSWAAILQFLVWRPLRRGESWAWWAILTSVLVWFAIDESFSLWFGVTINAVGNLVLLAWFVAPLLVLRVAK